MIFGICWALWWLSGFAITVHVHLNDEDLTLSNAIVVLFFTSMIGPVYGLLWVGVEWWVNVNRKIKLPIVLLKKRAAK